MKYNRKQTEKFLHQYISNDIIKIIFNNIWKCRKTSLSEISEYIFPFPKEMKKIIQDRDYQGKCNYCMMGYVEETDCERFRNVLYATETSYYSRKDIEKCSVSTNGCDMLNAAWLKFFDEESKITDNIMEIE